MTAIKSWIKAEAEKLGFCFCGFTDAGQPRDFERYKAWIKEGSYGNMTWMAREDHLAKRADPTRLLSSVRSICVLGMPYQLFPPDTVCETASFAHYEDYHRTLPQLANQLLGALHTALPDTPFEARVCVDAEPVLERSLAVQAGLGWIGRSSLFIHPHFGSAVLLCEILLSLEIEPDKPFTRDYCGQCHACVDACPGHCIDPQTRTIRADRCAAYLTIEHKGDFTHEQRDLIGPRVFGCDCCLRVCPWNRKNSSQTALCITHALPVPADAELSDAEFKEKYAGSSILRLKNKNLRRNLTRPEDEF